MPHLSFEFGFELGRVAEQGALAKRVQGILGAFGKCLLGGHRMCHLEAGMNFATGCTECCQFLRVMLRTGQDHFDAARERIENRACQAFETQLHPQFIPAPITLGAQDQEIKTRTGRMCWNAAQAVTRKRTNR